MAYHADGRGFHPAAGVPRLCESNACSWKYCAQHFPAADHALRPGCMLATGRNDGDEKKKDDDGEKIWWWWWWWWWQPAGRSGDNVRRCSHASPPTSAVHDLHFSSAQLSCRKRCSCRSSHDANSKVFWSERMGGGHGIVSTRHCH